MHFRLLAAAALLTAAPAHAATFNTLDGFGDAEFTALIDSGRYAEDSIAETRGGTQGLGGDFELAILDVTPPGPGGPTAVQRQFLFQSGQEYGFSLTLELLGNGDQRVTYVFDTAGAAITMIDEGPDVIQQGVEAVNAIYIRTRSDGVGDAFLIDDLSITTADGTMSSDLSVASSDAQPVDYLLISGFSGPFTLTGTQALSFPGSLPPERSRLAQQIKIGVLVPLPASAIMLLSGLAGVGWLARRRRG